MEMQADRETPLVALVMGDPCGISPELMAKLLRKLGEKGTIPDLYQRLQDRHRERERNYDNQQRRLFEAAVSSDLPRGSGGNLQSQIVDPDLVEAVSEIAETRKDKPWWVWLQEIEYETHVDRKESIYLQALESNPQSGPLLMNYADFLRDVRKDRGKAEKFYKRAVESDPEYCASLPTDRDFLRYTS